MIDKLAGNRRSFTRRGFPGFSGRGGVSRGFTSTLSSQISWRSLTRPHALALPPFQPRRDLPEEKVLQNRRSGDIYSEPSSRSIDVLLGYDEPRLRSHPPCHPDCPFADSSGYHGTNPRRIFSGSTMTPELVVSQSWTSKVIWDHCSGIHGRDLQHNERHGQEIELVASTVLRRRNYNLASIW